MAFKVQIVNTQENANNMILVSGLTIETIKIKYNWLLNATVKNCIIGEDDYGLVWYSGEWVCGEWMDGTWYSGTWDDGIWRNGKWYSYLIDNAKIVAGIFVILDKYHTYSVFKNGFWQKGDFYDGIFGDVDRDISTGITLLDIMQKDFPCAYWEDGRFHDGIFQNAIWMNGIFYNGSMSNSYWVTGNFYDGTFNHYIWYDGLWYGGDFVEGDWFNGSFDQINSSIKSRFGTANLSTSRTTWNGGVFYNGEFHSGLNVDSSGNTLPSINSNITHWIRGNFRGGKWYGGHFHSGDFWIGNWYGGIFNTPGATTQNNGIWHDGNWYDGLWINGVFLDGHFYDGMWLDGLFSGGYMSTNIVEGSLLPQSATANPVPPSVITYAATGMTSSSAILSGRVTNNGGATILDRGICWSILSPSVTGNTISNNYLSDGGSMGNISITAGNLSNGTSYFVRAYARNVTGITYGNEVTFNTIAVPISVPQVNTIITNNITDTSANGNGLITDSQSSPVTECGVYYSDILADPYPSGTKVMVATIPTGPNGAGPFIANLTLLTPLTTYKLRAYATNIYGTGIGNIDTFSTEAVSPVTACTVTTYDPVQSITNISAVVSAEVLTNGNGTILAVGACWSVLANPTISDPHTTDAGLTGPFTTTMTGLSPNTTYHVRAYATNTYGPAPTSYGEDRVFTTATVPTVIMVACKPI